MCVCVCESWTKQQQIKSNTTLKILFAIIKLAHSREAWMTQYMQINRCDPSWQQNGQNKERKKSNYHWRWHDFYAKSPKDYTKALLDLINSKSCRAQSQLIKINSIAIHQHWIIWKRKQEKTTSFPVWIYIHMYIHIYTHTHIYVIYLEINLTTVRKDFYSANYKWVMMKTEATQTWKISSIHGGGKSN